MYIEYQICSFAALL